MIVLLLAGNLVATLALLAVAVRIALWVRPRKVKVSHYVNTPIPRDIDMQRNLFRAASRQGIERRPHA